MMNKTKEDLLGLIKSLSMSEKRYFKIFIAQKSIGENSHYIKLFDIIDKKGSIDKKIIQKFYGNDNFIQKQFLKYKYLLYKQILKSLTAYHSEGSVDDKILESIRQAIILFNKNLYSDAEKLLEKAKSIAYKYEKHSLLSEIIRWQKKIITTWSIYDNTGEKQIRQIFKEDVSLIRQLENMNEYWERHALIYLSYRVNGVVRIQEDIDRYNAIIDAPPLKNEELLLSYQAKRSFYTTRFLYFTAVNNLNEAYKYAKKLVALMEAYPYQIEDNPAQYCNAYNNLLFTTQKLGKYEEFFDMISNLRAIARKFQLPLSVLLRMDYLKFSAFVDIGQFKKAIRLLPEIEAVFKDQGNGPEVFRQAFTLNKVMLYFGMGDYHEALISLNEVLNEEKKQLSQELHSFARIFQLIIHFEKKNTDLLPYLVKSVYRYLMQRNKLYKMETLFIRFIRTKLDKMNTKNDQIKAFKALREELVEICNDPREARFLEFFDIISWLESKIENRTFGEILREKSGYVLNEQ